jgi:hypothetical protein
MTANGLLADRLYFLLIITADQAARRLYDPRLCGRAHFPFADFGQPIESAFSIAGKGRSQTRAKLDNLCRSPCWPSAWRDSCFFTPCMRMQAFLPLQSARHARRRARSRLQHRVSFVTNTNWQSYGGETTMSYLSQMAGLTVHNFVSAATGIALAIALIRGFARRSAKTIGNFWVDLTRALYVLLPLAIVVGGVLIWQGMPQNFAPIPMRRRLKASSRLSRKGRWPRKKRSRCWAPMAAASSTPTPRIRSKTRRRFPI